MTTARPINSVTLLHKGLGPSLFQFESKPYPVADNEGQGLGRFSPPTPRSPNYGGRQHLSNPSQPPKKRVVVKCMDRQDANTMFTKRLQERAARHYRPATASPMRPAAAGPVQQQQCELYMRERLFTNTPHRPSSFPPPSFMSRWNPRHKDRTYLSKMVLEDPWSLSSEKRTELKKRTGLRLKSISRHYQYKVGANLPIGKDFTSKCTCFVNFCDHCSKPHPEYRCPLHMQLLDSFDPDCKTELNEFCPFSKNVEDIPLDKIQDPEVYVSEVVRRLKAGEIRDVPPFPTKLFEESQLKKWKMSKNNIAASAEPSTDTFDFDRKAVTEDSCTQTEPFIVDVDSKAAFKENMCQTRPLDKEEPMMLTSILRTIGAQGHYKRVPPKVEVSTQVTPCIITSFEQRAGKVAKQITKQVFAQSLQEISNELRLEEIQKERAHYTQQLVDLQRTAQFRYLREKWRNNAYVDELFEYEKEYAQEINAEQSICAIGFSMSYLWNFLGKVMDSVRREGFIVNEDLKAIRTELMDEFNRLMEEKLRKRDNSIKLLDDIINHAILDLEMDAFRGHLVDGKYLDPLHLTTRFLRDLLVLRDNNFEMIRRIQSRLFRNGWYIDEDGKLVRGTPTPDSSATSSDVSLDAFINGVRVSVDPKGNPKYLVDISGRTIPINVRWMPALQDQVEQKKDDEQSWRYDIVLDENSPSDAQNLIANILKTKKPAGPGTEYHKHRDGEDGEREGEGLGLDLDYIEGEIVTDDDDDDEDVGRLVFKRKTINDDEFDHEHDTNM